MEEEVTPVQRSSEKVEDKEEGEESSTVVEEEEKEPPTYTSAIYEGDEDSDGIWSSIASALDNWTRRIVDTETRLGSSSITLRQQINESLYRMREDGLLNCHDFDEMQHVGGLWMNLLNAAACYQIGCGFAKRDVITLLLDLYNLKQIRSSAFIDTCLQL